MPLKIRIKPDHTFKVGDVEMRNAGKAACHIVVLSNHNVDRDDYKNTGIAPATVRNDTPVVKQHDTPANAHMDAQVGGVQLTTTVKDMLERGAESAWVWFKYHNTYEFLEFIGEGKFQSRAGIFLMSDKMLECVAVEVIKPKPPERILNS